MTSRAERLLAELEEKRNIRRELRLEADARGEHSLATVHSVAQDAYADAYVMVAAALPTIISETTESWTPGELVEVFGK